LSAAQETRMSFVPILVIAQIGAPQKPSLVEVFVHAGPMAWCVASVLIVMSLFSWAIAFGRWRQMGRAQRASDAFLEVFRSSQRFSEVGAAAKRLAASPLVGLFEAGYAEIDAQIKNQRVPESGVEYRIRSLESLQRTLRRVAGSELRLLSKGTTFLATVAAAGPFIGLFGTVWGIMVAFQDIGVSGSTSLVAVAPGIAEALINTALGLVAAIPALLAYNYFAARLRHFRAELDDFTLEFLNLAERNFT
jgi:biopolymer transport protein TolQ